MSSEHVTERDAEAIRLYVEEGLTLTRIAARFGLSPPTVSQILARAGVRRRPRGPRPFPCSRLAQRNQEIIRAYVEEGLSLTQVGTRFDLRPSTVADILRKAGVSRRRRGTGSPKHLKARNGEIARLYAEGDLTLREIGGRFNLSRERVRQIARRAGVSRRRAKVRAEYLRERNLEIVRLYVEERLMLKEIGARLGVSTSLVSHVVSMAGVSRRRSGRGGRKKGIPLAPVEYRRKRNQEIIRLYLEEGLTCREIGTRFGLTRSGVEYILHAAGVSRRSSGWRSSWPWKDAEERRREIVDAYVEKSLSIDKVAALFGISRITVAGVLEKAGVAGPRRK